jgi:hypothetical protein
MQKLWVESSEARQIFCIIRIGFLIAACNGWNLTGVCNDDFVT